MNSSASSTAPRQERSSRTTRPAISIRLPVTGFSSRRSAPLLKRGVLLPTLLQPLGPSSAPGAPLWQPIFLKLFNIMSIFLSIESLCLPRGCLAAVFLIITESYCDGRTFIRVDSKWD